MAYIQNSSYIHTQKKKIWRTTGEAIICFIPLQLWWVRQQGTFDYLPLDEAHCIWLEA